MSLALAVAATIAQIVPLLSSDKAGEVAGAVAAIERVLRSSGCDWHDLAQHVASPSIVPARRPNDGRGARSGRARSTDWRAGAQWRARHAHQLGAKERDFILNMATWDPTERQMKWLLDIERRLRREKAA